MLVVLCCQRLWLCACMECPAFKSTKEHGELKLLVCWAASGNVLMLCIMHAMVLQLSVARWVVYPCCWLSRY